MSEALNGPVILADYDPARTELYAELAGRITGALRARVRALHHAGSTSVPGLAAKPIIDIVLEVADSTDEGDYVPALAAAGFAFILREPEWFQHRLLKSAAPKANLHVFSEGCEETARMLAFRDRLRANLADRGLYEATKRELAARTWAVVQDYADAKSAVVADIMTRVRL